MPVVIIDVDALARDWWVVLLRGLAAIGFGLITALAPGISLATLVILFDATWAPESPGSRWP